MKATHPEAGRTFSGPPAEHACLYRGYPAKADGSWGTRTWRRAVPGVPGRRRGPARCVDSEVEGICTATGLRAARLPVPHHKRFALKEQSSESEGIPGQTWSVPVRAENGATGRTDAFTGSSGQAIFMIRGCRAQRGMGNCLGFGAWNLEFVFHLSASSAFSISAAPL